MSAKIPARIFAPKTKNSGFSFRHYIGSVVKIDKRIIFYRPVGGDRQNAEDEAKDGFGMVLEKSAYVHLPPLSRIFLVIESAIRAFS